MGREVEDRGVVVVLFEGELGWHEGAEHLTGDGPVGEEEVSPALEEESGVRWQGSGTMGGVVCDRSGHGSAWARGGPSRTPCLHALDLLPPGK